MRYLLIMIAMLGFTAVPAWSQTDTASFDQSAYSCAFTTPTTLACVKGAVDENNDGMLDSDEWARVPEEDRAIIDLEDQFGEEAGAVREEPLEIGVPEDPAEGTGIEDPVYEDDPNYPEVDDPDYPDIGTEEMEKEHQFESQETSPDASGEDQSFPGDNNQGSEMNY